MQWGQSFAVIFPELNHVLGVYLDVVVLMEYTISTHFPVVEPAAGKLYCCFLLICNLRLDQQGLLSACSVPALSELMETCIDDVLKAPGIPAVMAADEAGPSSTYAAPSATGEDSLSLSGEVTLSSHSRKSWLSASFETSFSTVILRVTNICITNVSSL